jgi:hypothetical protein
MTENAVAKCIYCDGEMDKKAMYFLEEDGDWYQTRDEGEYVPEGPGQRLHDDCMTEMARHLIDKYLLKVAEEASLFRITWRELPDEAKMGAVRDLAKRCTVILENEYLKDQTA